MSLRDAALVLAPLSVGFDGRDGAVCSVTKHAGETKPQQQQKQQPLVGVWNVKTHKSMKV